MPSKSASRSGSGVRSSDMDLFTLYKRAIGLLAAAPKSAADPEPTCRPPGGPLIVPQHSRVFRMRWTPPQSAPESALGVKPLRRQ
jgi:hypothetical protein